MEKKPRLLISYEFADPAHTDVVSDALEALGAEKIQSRVWVLRTDESIASILDKLAIYFGQSDDLFIAQILDSVILRRSWRPAIGDFA